MFKLQSNVGALDVSYDRYIRQSDENLEQEFVHSKEMDELACIDFGMAFVARAVVFDYIGRHKADESLAAAGIFNLVNNYKELYKNYCQDFDKEYADLKPLDRDWARNEDGVYKFNHGGICNLSMYAEYDPEIIFSCVSVALMSGYTVMYLIRIMKNNKLQFIHCERHSRDCKYMCCNCSSKRYKKFLVNIQRITKNWVGSYSSDCYDGGSVKVNCRDINIDTRMFNSEPNNYGAFMRVINRYFPK